MSTIKGIIDALAILKDYPGIEEYVDIKKAKRFLNFLEKSGVYEIPKIDEEMRSVADEIAKSTKSSLDDWEELLRKLSGLGYLFTIEDRGHGQNQNGELFSGCFYSTYGDIFANNPSFGGGFNFYSENLATLEYYIEGTEGESLESITNGTWKEVYLELARYTLKHLTISDIPEDDDDDD